VRRPQKTFVVEVKRARKGAVAKILGAETHKIEADPSPGKSNEPLAPELEAPPAEAAPPRRILEAITPPPAPEISDPAPELSHPTPVVTKPTPRRPRGRPPKSAGATSLPTIAAASPAVAKAPRPEAKNRPLAAPRKRLAAAEVVPALPARLPTSAPGPTPHVTHGDRVEAATSLPRGERWKRRLPKVLW
jgi:hypothetical protein